MYIGICTFRKLVKLIKKEIKSETDRLEELIKDKDKVISKELPLGSNYFGSVRAIIGRGMCTVTIEVTPINDFTNGEIICTGLPKPARGNILYLSLAAGEYNYSALLRDDTLSMYFLSSTEKNRVDTTFSYLIDQ